MDLREVQAPLKQGYRDDPSTALITLTARGSQTDAPVTCSVDLGRELYEAQAHTGVGGPAGFGAIRVRFDVDAPDADDDQLAALGEKTERYCTVMQTLLRPPPIEVALERAAR